MAGETFRDIIDDHIAWCRKEHEAALRQVQLFAAGGVKALVQTGGGVPDDITQAVIRHGREVVEKTSALIAAWESRETDI